MSRCNIYFLIQNCVYLTFVIIVVLADHEECDETKCMGPLAYYKSLGCKPVYENKDDCCAVKYNCNHLKERSTNKCYVNGKMYELGAQLKKEDANPCDHNCFCANLFGIASFNCPAIDCFYGSIESGCYMQRFATKCCAGPLVCPEKQEDRATCLVDGKTYKDGEHFDVASDPELNCFCHPEYKGENVAPFCSKQNRAYCDPFFGNAHDVQNQCAPIYYTGQSPQTNCSSFFRCQNSDDYVVHTHDSDEAVDEINVCRVGNLTMHLRDELNRKPMDSPSCMKCLCEVPPVPTCMYLSDSKCDEL